MSRISGCFEQLSSANKKALIPYIVGGDPNLSATLSLMHALVGAGANIIELGIPFSDPSADGPIIQLAAERALSKNTSLIDVLTLVKSFREQDTKTPIVLMGYLNPIECMGYQEFANKAKLSGVDGVLVVDMPPEESSDLLPLLKQADIDCIFLIAPTTKEERARSICQHSSGYLYYVSLKGVTGAAHLDVNAVAESLEQLRKYTTLPIGVGFGISDAQSASSISQFADGVVVGSALVKKVAELDDIANHSQSQLNNAVSIIKSMREAMDSISTN